MLSVFILLLLVGAAISNHEYGWSNGKEYIYEINSRTVTAFHKVGNRYTGILIKGSITVQRQDDDTLRAQINNPKYSEFHTTLNGEWDSKVPDDELNFVKLPISNSPFEIKLNHGIVRDLIVSENIPTWELNFLKSIISQLQLDMKGENVIINKYNQIPDEGSPFGMFNVMEETVTGKCEVLYDISPFLKSMINKNPELMPMPQLRQNEDSILVMKTKNFSNCEQRMMYHFGFSGHNNFEPGSNENGKFHSRSSISRVIMSGNLKNFIVQSSETTDQILMSPTLYDVEQAMVSSRVNLTLQKFGDIKIPLPSLLTRQSTGNLVYNFNSPFDSTKNQHTSRSNLNEKKLKYKFSKENKDSNESKEENDYLQPKPKLEDAPDIPFLPYFIGKDGHSLWISKEVDIVDSVKVLTQKIGKELQKPNEMMDEQTLEKMTILTRLIRTMNVKQIDNVTQSLYQSKHQINIEDDNKKLLWNYWIIFHHAVVQAGTGPALVSIKTWIKQNMIKDFDAAKLVAHLSKTTRTPTLEYIEEFFELVIMPEVVKQNVLHETAVLNFANLVRYAIVQKRSAHNKYPVHTFGPFSSKEDDIVFKKYIPYLTSQLKEAIKDGNNPKIQVFISAIGRIAHPKILSIFEPFLEGKEVMSKFQRTWIVYSLKWLTSAWPKIARPILYKIYMNTGDDYEVRCAAVFLIMKTNPPVSMLQRMATFTNYDRSKHVSSVVKSSIVYAAELDEFSELGRNARAATPLLNPRRFGLGYSKSYLNKVSSKNMYIIEDFIFNNIGSDDSLFLKGAFVDVKFTFGGKTFPTITLGSMISSMDNLLLDAKKFFSSEYNENQNHRISKWAPENLAEMLQIEAEDPEQLEGNIFMDSIAASLLFAFDNHTLNEIFNSFKYTFDSTEEESHSDIFSFASYDLTLSFPTESGFPFIFTLKMPTVQKIDSEFHMYADDKHSENTGDPKSISIDVKMNFIYAANIQGRMGFVAPFESKHYMAGYDKQFQLFLPIHHEGFYETAKNRFSVKLKPLKRGEPYKVLQIRNTPFTCKSNIMLLEPVGETEDMTVVNLNEIEVVKFQPGLGISWRSEFEKSNEKINNIEEISKSLKSIFMPWHTERIRYSKHVFMWKSNKEREQFLQFTIAHDDIKNLFKEFGDSTYWQPNAKTSTILSKEIDSENRRKQLLLDAVKEINYGQSDVVDMSVTFSGWENSTFVLTLAYGRSNVDIKTRGLLFFRGLFNGDNETAIENCINIETKIPHLPVLNIDRLLTSDLSNYFDVDVGIGHDCKGSKVKIRGQLRRSEERQNDILTRREAQECIEENEKGNKALIACQNIATVATALDLLEMSFTFDDSSLWLKNLMFQVIQFWKDEVQGDKTMNALDPKNKDENKIDMSLRVTPENTLNIMIYAPYLDIAIENINLVDKAADLMNVHIPKIQKFENQIDKEAIAEREPTCILDGSEIKTFDDKIYPVEIGKCWHVFLTTYPKENPYNSNKKLQIPENIRTSILGRDILNKQREIKVILGPNEILFYSDGSGIKIKVNDESVKIDHDESFLHGEMDEVAFEIFALTNESYTLLSDKYEIQVVYDGKHVQIQALDVYRKTIRGLCGDFDGESENDFETPQKCIKKNPEEFVATWALTKEECDGPSLKYAAEALQTTCTRQHPRPSNVISDEEAGRSND